MNVFLDTNVIIDFMGEREGFFDDASVVFSLIAEGKIRASASALTIVNCAYILKKAFNTEVMFNKVESLCEMLEVLPINKSQLKEAVRLKPYDYEDAVQYLSAQPGRPDVIITRDKRGFMDFDILVMTPTEFIRKAKG